MNGYSWKHVLATVIAEGLGSTILIAGVKDYFCADCSPHMRLDASLMCMVMFNLVLAEVAFTSGHAMLHLSPSLAPLHVMHHACTAPTITTNLIFHPVDLAIEFSGPILFLILSHVFLFQDPFVLTTSLLVLHLWYAYDHDPNLNLYHIQHHKYIDSIYTIYTKFRLSDPKADLVKPLVKLK
jgi:sterol desaturase/sphingolipid hydroxylase (fatty acid hydroxylase superfamily)